MCYMQFRLVTESLYHHAELSLFRLKYSHHSRHAMSLHVIRHLCNDPMISQGKIARTFERNGRIFPDPYLHISSLIREVRL